MKKKKDKIIVGTEVLLLCMILGILRINAASSNPSSSEVNYNKNSQTNVQDSINDLYNKVNYGDAKANEILNGKKALVGGKEIIGTYTCTVSASQTPGDAKPEDITEGKIAWVNGRKVVGTRTSLADKVQLGDYISYEPDDKEITLTYSDTGSTQSQKISTVYDKSWRVIRKNEDGTVEIILISTGKTLTFGSDSEEGKKIAYKNYVGTLNSIAKLYEKEGYTVGSRNAGYDSHKAYKYLTDEDIDNGIGIDDGYKTDETLIREALGNLEAVGKQYYWLASRASADYRYVHYVGHHSSANDPYGVESVWLNGSYISQDKNGYNYAQPKPIVILKTTLKITGGDGTRYSPYTLGV